MSSREEYPLISPVVGGIKMEPLETDASTDDLRENYSSHPVKGRIPSPSDHPNQLYESKVFIDTRLTKFSPYRMNLSYSSTSCAPSFPLREEISKPQNTFVKVPKSKRWPTCRICGKTFLKPSLLLNHRADVHNDYPKKCLECGKPEKKNKKLRQHMRIHHPTKLITCDVCSDGFLTNKDVKKHYKRMHQGKSTRSWYVPTFENSASSCVESKDNIMKTEESADVSDVENQVSIFENSASSSVESKNSIMKIEESADVNTVESKVSTFENSAFSSVESKDNIMKVEEPTDITMETVESKDNFCLPIIKAEPIW